MSYATRPLLWAISVLAVIFACLDWFVAHDTRNTEIAYPTWPRSLVERIDFPQDLERVRAAGRQNDVEAIKLSQLWPPRNEITVAAAGTPRTITAPGEDFYKILDEFPHLQAVEYYGWPGSQAGLDKVLRLPGLEYLQLSGACTFDMSRLAAARNVRYLTFTSYQPAQNIAALAALPHLETVVFETRQSADDAVLAEVAQLPQLKTLVLALSPSSPADKPLTAAGFDALRSSPSLENLYVGGWQQDVTDQYLPLAMRAWPKLSVQPSRKKMFPFLPDFVRVLPFVVLAGTIGAQLSSQFRSPLRKLAPRFARDQAIVATLLLLLVTAAFAMRLVISGALAVAAVTVSGSFVLLAMSITAFTSVQYLIAAAASQSIWTSRPPPFGPPWLQKPWRWLVGCSGIVQVGLIVALLVPSWMGYVLRSGDYRVLVTLAVSIVISLVFLAQSFSQVVYWGATATPQPAKGLPASAAYRETWLSAGAERESRIEALSHKRTADMTWWQRVDRWRLANFPMRVLRMTAFMFVTCLVSQWILNVKLLGLNNMSDGGRSIVSFAAGFALILPGFQLAAIWRGRMATLSIESMRPYSRRALRYEWMAAFLADLLPSVAVVSLLGAIGVNWHPPFTIIWQAIPLSLLQLFPAALAVSAASAALGAVIQRGWVVVLLGVGLLMTLLFGTMMAIIVDFEWIRHVHMEPREMSGAFLTHAWGAGVLAAIVIAILARRFFTMEAGRRA